MPQVVVDVASYSLTVNGVAVTLAATGLDLVTLLQGIQAQIPSGNVHFVDVDGAEYTYGTDCCISLKVQWKFSNNTSATVCEFKICA